MTNISNPNAKINFQDNDKDKIEKLFWNKMLKIIYLHLFLIKSWKTLAKESLQDQVALKIPQT